MPDLRAQAKAKAKVSTTKSSSTTTKSSSALRAKASNRPKTLPNSSSVMDDAQKQQEDKYKPPKFDVEVPASNFGYITLISKIPSLRKEGEK